MKTHLLFLQYYNKKVCQSLLYLQILTYNFIIISHYNLDILTFVIIYLTFLKTFEMQETELDPEQIQKRKKLWKLFGRQTKAGKQLFNLYNLAEKPKIEYPKPKPKSQKQIDAEKQKMIITKKCPQKTQIQYPELPKKQGPKYHAVDFIPKRKAESVIRQEIQQYYRRRTLDIPANRGVDRANLVKKLQDKFKMQSGILPKGAQLPGLEKVDFDQEKIKQQAKLKIDKKAQSFSNPLKNQKEDAKENRNVKDQLDELFDQIVQQIDDRQAYLESIQHLQQPKLKEKIKKEMIQRIAQLQRITEIKKEQK